MFLHKVVLPHFPFLQVVIWWTSAGRGRLGSVGVVTSSCFAKPTVVCVYTYMYTYRCSDSNGLYFSTFSEADLALRMNVPASHNISDFQSSKFTCGIFELRHDKTNKMSVRPAKTQISLGIRPVWSESSLCAQSVAKDPSFLHTDSEDSDQTGRINIYTCRWLSFLRWDEPF